jgi:hypothetical protein
MNNKELKTLKELFELTNCISMIESICCYNCGNCYSNNEYLKKYVEMFGQDKVEKMISFVQNNIEKIEYAGEDCEGCSYNSMIYKDQALSSNGLEKILYKLENLLK